MSKNDVCGQNILKNPMCQETTNVDPGSIAFYGSSAAKLNRSVAQIRALENDELIGKRVEELVKLLSLENLAHPQEIEECIYDVLRCVNDEQFARHANLLIESSISYFSIGKTHQGISIAVEIARYAEQFRNFHAQRRILNVLGLQYTDVADFPRAMQSLQSALLVATKIGDETKVVACTANVMTLMQEMGHYRQAISMAEAVLSLDSSSEAASELKLQCSVNGLFSAHRLGDATAAARFLVEGQKHLPRVLNPLLRAFFEKDRALFLIESGNAELASELIAPALESAHTERNPRVRVLLRIGGALCEWASGKQEVGRELLRQIYAESKDSRLYHHLVLQALIKTYREAASPEDVASGLGYSKELVEYTTSVKKAKFYRQLKKKKVAAVGGLQGRECELSEADLFATMREWLSSTNVEGAPESGGEPRELAKHEELTAIHEDMAKLRAASLRREIRTDAVDTAENWAIAAELFDDETGRHCYRVGHLAGMLAREIGMNDTFCVQVEHAARLHDIGKIAVNEVILLKPGPLDASEMAAMRLHTEVGAQMLAGSDDPTLKMAAEIARHHHEWWNGGGYPKRLIGRETPLSARICAFADVYDALTHVRAYKVAWTHERALEEFHRLRTIQFDPDLFDPFLNVLERYLMDLDANTIPGFADMDSNALISSRRKLMETIAAGNK